MKRPWLKKFEHQNKGMRGVRVYYLMHGTTTICSDIAVRTSGNTIEFPDGSWNAAADCYLTKGQCRRASGLGAVEALKHAAKIVGRASESLQDLDERLTKAAREQEQRL